MKRQMSYVPMIICWSLIVQAQLWQGRILQTPFFGPNTACRQMQITVIHNILLLFMCQSVRYYDLRREIRQMTMIINVNILLISL